jgi:RecA-family ATPase
MTSPPKLLPFIDPITFQGQDVPKREWMVDGLVPRRATTLLFGDGGTGKSLLAMQMLTAAALGKDFLGRQTAAVKSLGMFCEDGRDELHFRQDNINRFFEADFGDLDKLRWIPGQEIGDTELMTFHEGARSTRTATYVKLFETIRDFGAQLIVLDSLHDLFAGNENVRYQVRSFVNALTAVALEINGAVVVVAHPSRTGIATGTGDSGSTGWGNSVRSRLYLTHPDKDSDTRTLSVMKANWTRAGEKIEIQYQDGAFAPTEGGGIVDRLEIERKLLAAAEEYVRLAKIAADPAAHTSLISRALKRPELKGAKYEDVVSAQQKLIDDGRLVVVELGRPSHRYKYVRPANARYSEEK